MKFSTNSIFLKLIFISKACKKHVFLLLLCLIVYSCSKDDNNSPISLNYTSNDPQYVELSPEGIDLIYQTPVTLKILGSIDNNYLITSSNRDQLDFKIQGNLLELYPGDNGTVDLEIVNQDSGDHYKAEVHINYFEENYITTNTEVTIVGNGLSVSDSLQILNDIKPRLPVQIKGGYTFEYTDRSKTLGNLYIYTSKFADGVPFKGTFTRQNTFENGFNSSIIYNLEYEDQSRRFRLVINESTQDTIFTENYNEIYSLDFPISRVSVLQYLNSFN